jgi:hypothetical protein
VITAVALGQFQAMVASTLTTTADVLRPSTVDDTSGGQVRTMATVATDVPCRFSRVQVTPRETETTRGVRLIVYWRFTFAAGTDIRPTDRILTNGRTFEVVSGGEGNPSAACVAICLEIT